MCLSTCVLYVHPIYSTSWVLHRNNTRWSSSELRVKSMEPGICCVTGGLGWGRGVLHATASATRHLPGSSEMNALYLIKRFVVQFSTSSLTACTFRHGPGYWRSYLQLWTNYLVAFDYNWCQKTSVWSDS